MGPPLPITWGLFVISSFHIVSFPCCIFRPGGITGSQTVSQSPVKVKYRPCHAQVNETGWTPLWLGDSDTSVTGFHRSAFRQDVQVWYVVFRRDNAESRFQYQSTAEALKRVHTFFPGIS